MEFSAEKITKLYLNTSAFNLQIIGKKDIENIICKLNFIEDDWIQVRENDDCLTLSVTEKGSTIRTIWRSKSERSVKIYVPEAKTFKSIKIMAGIGNIRMKNIRSGKLDFSAGLGFSKLVNVEVKKRVKVSAGLGRLSITKSSLNNLSLNAGIGLFQFSGKLFGKNIVKGGVGKIELLLYTKRADYDIKTKSSFFDNIYIDGILSKNYRSEAIDRDEKLRISGGLGVINVRFKQKS